MLQLFKYSAVFAFVLETRLLFGQFFSEALHIQFAHTLRRQRLECTVPRLANRETRYRPSSIVIGWRQFDNIASNFRQGGWSFTTDGGQSWTFPGVLTPGIFRSDPVIHSDADGNFFYQSLLSSFDLTLFKSVNGGASWDNGVFAFGGDKNWQAIDTTGGIGNGNIYGTWQKFFGCCDDATPRRSLLAFHSGPGSGRVCTPASRCGSRCSSSWWAR